MSGWSRRGGGVGFPGVQRAVVQGCSSGGGWFSRGPEGRGPGLFKREWGSGGPVAVVQGCSAGAGTRRAGRRGPGLFSGSRDQEGRSPWSRAVQREQGSGGWGSRAVQARGFKGSGEPWFSGSRDQEGGVQGCSGRGVQGVRPESRGSAGAGIRGIRRVGRRGPGLFSRSRDQEGRSPGSRAVQQEQGSGGPVAGVQGCSAGGYPGVQGCSAGAGGIWRASRWGQEHQGPQTRAEMPVRGVGSGAPGSTDEG